MNKIIVVGMSLLFFTLSVQSQEKQKISGVVKDELSNTPIPFVTIATYIDDLLVDGTSTDENGRFSFKTEKDFNRIQFSFIGYKSLVLEKNNIPNTKKWEISLGRDETELDEVVVTSRQSTTEILVDRKVINLGADIQQSGKDMLEAMEQISEVNVDRMSGNLSLRGSGNVKILINGKPSGLSVADLLQQIPASTVSRVEIITSPSAKHRADGMTGIINIITKRNIHKGLNLNASTTARSPSPEVYRLGMSGNYNYNFYNVRFGLNHSQRNMNSSQNMLRNYTDNTSERINSSHSFLGDINNLNSGVDFFIDKKNELSFSFNYSDNRHPIKRETLFSEITNQSDYSSFFNSKHIHKTSEGNTNYRHSFDKNHFIEFDYNININKNMLDTDIEQQFFSSSEDITFNNQLHHVSIDYTLPVNKELMLEAGTLFNSRSLVNIRNTVGGNQEDTFKYHEDLWAGYAMLKQRIKKLSLQYGIRYEYLGASSESSIDGSKELKSFSNFFPSFHASYRFNEKHQLNGGYSKRISRPNFYHLKPFNPNTTYSAFEGNPRLGPEYGHNAEINYQFRYKKIRISTIGFIRKRTDIIEHTYRLEGNTIITSNANLGKGESYGLETTIRTKPFKFWSMVLGGNYYWGKINTTQNLAFLTRNNWALNFRNTFDIGRYITTDFYFRYNGKRSGYTTISQPNSWLNWSIRAHLLEKKLTITFDVADLFNNDLIRKSTSYTPFYEEYRRSRFGKKYNRTFGLSISYKIIQASTKRRKRKQRNYNLRGTKD